MKLLVLFKTNSERARKVEEFLHDFTRLHPGINIKQIDVDTRDGSAIAALYDVVDPPAILATKDDGTVLQTWQGEMLPLMDEVASYAI